MDDINEQIRKAEADLRRLQAKRDYLRSLQPSQTLAIALHGGLCHENHTDGCGWLYEVHNEAHDWDGRIHTRFLVQACRLLEKGHAFSLTEGQLLDLLRAGELIK